MNPIIFNNFRLSLIDWLADAIERLWDKTQVRWPVIFNGHLLLGFCALVGHYIALVSCWYQCSYELIWTFFVVLLATNRRRLA